MKKFVVIILLVVVAMATVSANADVWSDYEEQLAKVEQNIFYESNGHVSMVVEFNDVNGHWMWVEADSTDADSAHMTLYNRVTNGVIYEMTITEENCEDYYEIVTQLVFGGI